MREPDCQAIELRALWGGFGAALVTVALLYGGRGWMLIAVGCWLPLAFLLMKRERCTRLWAASWVLIASRASRGSLWVLLGVIALAGLVFGVPAMLFLGCIAASGIGFGTLVSVQRLGASLQGAAIGATTLALSLGAVELLLRLPRVAAGLGLPQEVSRDLAAQDGLWKHNFFGFRSRYETIAHSPTVVRILVLGDSFTFGDKVSLTDSTWPAQLETLLNRHTGTPQIEVVNTAARGYTTANEVELLRRIGWQFTPDLIIIQFLVNDALPSAPEFQRRGEAFLYPPVRLLPALFRRGPVAGSALLALVERRANALRYGPQSYMQYFRLYSDSAIGWRQTQTALGELGKTASDRHVPAVLVLFPYLVPGTWSAASYPLKDIHARVGAIAAQAGLEVLDLVPVFAREGGDWRRWWTTPYDAHPSAAAQTVAARSVAELLQSHRLLPEVGSAAASPDLARPQGRP